MAESARLVFRRTKEKSIGNILIDSFVEENHERTSKITRYPIEDGSTISDHIINDPDAVSITGVVMRTTILSPNPSTDRALTAYTEILQLMENKQLISLSTGLQVYSDMHIESFTVPRNFQTGADLTFSMKLVNARIAKSQTTLIPQSQLIDGDLQSQGVAELGKTSSGQTQDEETATSSLLKGVQDGKAAISIFTGFSDEGLQ